MADYHEERTLTAKTKTGTTATRLQEPQESPEKRYMLEKGRETRRNDSGLKHKTSLLNILFAQTLARLRVYILESLRLTTRCAKTP